MRVCFFSLLLGYSLMLASQENHFKFASYSEPSADKNFFRLGDKVLTLVKHGSDDNKPFVLLSLHNNEYTALQTGRNYIEENGGSFYELANNNERLVSFQLMDKEYLFDPNRIFTYKGREANLKMNKSWTRTAHDQVLLFARFILNEIPERKTIVALHNNTDEEYNIHDYKKGGRLAKDAKEVFINPALDVDDFYLTTDDNLFERLKAQNYNTVLQSANGAADDGSLSVYCAKVNRNYINIETQFDHIEEQQMMLYVLEKVLKDF